MKKYFYSDGKEKHGPFSIEELNQENIEKDTLIWFEGLDDWESASELEEIKRILELKPPPIFSLAREPEKEHTQSTTQDINSTDNQSSQKTYPKQGMFSNPFSFEGRIRRTEFGLSLIIYMVLYMIVIAIMESVSNPIISLIAFFPILWFIWAQGAKRCHDMGNSGWLQIIPFYVLWMLFANGEQGISNEYGVNPKNHNIT